MSSKVKHKYVAFISYSHRDEKIAAWLHRRLEQFRIPAAFVRKSARYGEVPKRLFPIFRDKDELATSSDLGAVIREALGNSGALIVVCSPDAAKSRWVNEEVRQFKTQHPSYPVLGLIVGGEPNSGGEEECFPAAIGWVVDVDGNVLDETIEPIAADIRPKHDHRRVAILRLIAGLTGLDFDALRQRDGIRRRWRAAATTALCASLLFLVATLSTLAIRNRQRAAESLVDAVLTARDEAVPSAIQNLRPLESLAKPILQQRFVDSSRERTERLHAACALAQFGHHEQDYLIEGINWAASAECPNLVTALRHDSASALDKLKKRFSAEQNPTLRVRLAITMLHLGDTGATQSTLSLGPDPSQRTAFIHGLETWHGDAADLVGPLRATQDSAFRSGLSLAVGRIPVAGAAEAKQALYGVLLDLYQQAPDGATHSATAWTLRQWGVELPKIAVGLISHPPAARSRRQWFVNSQGQTMIEIPTGGSFARKRPTDPTGGNNVIEQTVTLTRALYLSACEVSVAEFQRFVDDAAYAVTEKPQEWLGANKTVSPTGAHPVQNVNWYDAVLYCNWLSRKQGLTPCYERTGAKEKSTYQKDAEGRPVEYDAWRLVAGGTGYRLPTDAESEYACRSGTKTLFGHGNEEPLLAAYAVFKQSTSQPCGEKLPNAWGLFDMHGNVSEWCHNCLTIETRGDLVKDPIDPTEGQFRAERGGHYVSTATDCWSEWCSMNDASIRIPYTGFRVAAVSSPSK